MRVRRGRWNDEDADIRKMSRAPEALRHRKAVPPSRRVARTAAMADLNATPDSSDSFKMNIVIDVLGKYG